MVIIRITSKIRVIVICAYMYICMNIRLRMKLFFTNVISSENNLKGVVILRNFSIIDLILIYCLKNSSNPLSNDRISSMFRISTDNFTKLLDSAVKDGRYYRAADIVNRINMIRGYNKDRRNDISYEYV